MKLLAQTNNKKQDNYCIILHKNYIEAPCSDIQSLRKELGRLKTFYGALNSDEKYKTPFLNDIRNIYTVFSLAQSINSQFMITLCKFKVYINL